jgi:DegV family protein with EDD domain
MSELLTLENTAIVLDSTCDAPEGWLDQAGLYMVPLKVHFGDQMFRDGVDMTYKEFFAKLEQSEVLPTTSQPTAGEFTTVYEEALKHYEHVFSLHISGEMSGTVRAAEQAAQQFDHVYVYDMRTVTTALSLCAERLRVRLAGGCTLDEAHAYVRHFRDESQLLVHAATLEYLRRGGRIGLAASFVGGVFDIKPLIAAVDGTLTGYAKVRGLKKALAAMQRFVEEFVHAVRGGAIEAFDRKYRDECDLLCSTMCMCSAAKMELRSVSSTSSTRSMTVEHPLS